MQKLFHDEQTQPLSGPDLPGQSQTRSAQYSRNYRKNPEKNRKINEDRRRNYKMKKEGVSNVSPIFMESEASPATNEPRTIENVLNRSDKASLPNLGGEASGELSNSSRNYCQKEQMVALNGSKKESIEVESSSLQIQNQAELLVELRDSFRGIESALKTIQESIKPATPPSPIDFDKQEQQVASESAINANPGNLTKTFDGEKKKTVANRIIEKLPAFGLSILILTFLGFNTYFLVSEQQSLYMSMSYSAGMALMIAILSEASLILLSTMASWTSNLEWKIGLTAGMIAMLAVMVGILDSSAKSRVNNAARKSEEYKNLIQERETLRGLREPILARIKKLSPEGYPTLISVWSETKFLPLQLSFFYRG